MNINLEDDRVLTCVQRCLFLVSDADQRLALLLCGPNEMMGYPKIHIEVMAQDASAAERVLAELRSSMRKRNVYRGMSSRWEEINTARSRCSFTVCRR